MFVRTSTRRNRDGTAVSYLQLVHNEWDPAAKSSKMKVVYNFGRADQVDRAGIERLIGSLTRVLGSEAMLPGAGTPGLEFTQSRPLGGAYVLNGLWDRLGLAKTLRGLLGTTRRDPVTERVLFALVANRALAPSSKLAATSWVNHDVHLPGLVEVSDDACYRAMDWLLTVEATLAKDVYHQVADLLNLEVDLLFFDTTSTYFVTDQADEPVWRDRSGRPVEPAPDASADGTVDGTADCDEVAPPAGGVKQAGFRTWGKSKDHRDDLPQVVVGMAVTRDGIPVRCWCWPGNTSDSALIRQVKDDLRDWSLARVVWVADRGFTSAENRRYLQRGAGGYILGEKLRSGTPEADAALARPGRYQQVAGNLRVKEVKISDHERFVVCHNPEAAERDATVRTHLVEHLHGLIADTDRLPQRSEPNYAG